jgi:glycosyltransferase involved in cell wall biosynthesis
MKSIGILALARECNGGTLLYTLSMIEALQTLPKDDFEFTVFTTEDNHEYDSCSMPIVRVPGAAGLLIRRLIGINPFRHVDALVAPVYSTSLLFCGRPFAFTLHDLQERYYPQYFSLAMRAWRWLSNRLLTKSASRIICESRFVQRDIADFFGVPQSRVAVIPAPPVASLRDGPGDSASIAAIRQKFGLPKRFVFYPAQFWPHKNHRRLVEAFALVRRLHPDCVLVLTGKERDEFDRVFARVRELGLQEHVRHIGYVEKSELAMLYRAATVVAVPTLFESISIPVYEAFSLETAVCASNVVALPEQVGDAGLLFDPFSSEDIAEKISMLLGDPSLRATLVERGRARMCEVTHADYGRRLAALIEQTIRSGGVA